MSDTPRTDAFAFAEDRSALEMFAFARQLEREVANVCEAYKACSDDLIKCDEDVMRWFKAASPYATPGSLERGLKKLEGEIESLKTQMSKMVHIVPEKDLTYAAPVAWVHKDAAILKQGKTFHPSLAHEYIPVYAAPQAATGIVPPESSAPADAALTCLCLSFPKACPVHRGGPIDSTVKPSAWD